VVRHALFSDRTVPRIVAKLIFVIAIRQFERDLPIWNNKKFNKAPAFVKSDARVVAFRRWYSQFYSKRGGV
jgi:cholesterol 7-desaturase